MKLKTVLKYRLVIFIFLCFSSLTSIAQHRKSINYIIPKEVSDTILSYLKKQDKKVKPYVVFGHQNDTTFIIIASYSKSFSDLYKLIKNSHRFLIVNSSVNLPVLLGEDLEFSDQLHKVIRKGTPFETVNHHLINPAGFSVIYTGMYTDVSIIEAKWYQF